jgi:hypothetical protein
MAFASEMLASDKLSMSAMTERSTVFSKKISLDEPEPRTPRPPHTLRFCSAQFLGVVLSIAAGCFPLQKSGICTLKESKGWFGV